MHVITRKRLIEFSEYHPDVKVSLDRWYRIIKHSDFNSFADLRKTFPSADQIGRLTVFNIGGGKYRLIAYLIYSSRRVYIRHILTHNEYDRGLWKE